jgi:hypothetical protein
VESESEVLCTDSTDLVATCFGPLLGHVHANIYLITFNVLTV